MSREPIRIRFSFNILRCHKMCYGILVDVSIGYLPDTGKLLTRYAPFRRSPPRIAPCAAPRLACVKPVASVHPEPGSNSSLFKLFLISLARIPSLIVVQGLLLDGTLSRYTRFRFLYYLSYYVNILKDRLAIAQQPSSFLDCGCKGTPFF